MHELIRMEEQANGMPKLDMGQTKTTGQNRASKAGKPAPKRPQNDTANDGKSSGQQTEKRVSSQKVSKSGVENTGI